MFDQRGIGLTSQRSRDRLVRTLHEMGIESAEVLDVIRAVPRHLFVDEALAGRAYENNALPIGFGQTISQPYIVARMTEALMRTGPVQRVLEIGAGSGYQSAVLARIARQVYSIERIAALAQRLRQRMRELGHLNVSVRHGDGRHGWKSNAPYDAILVAAAPIGVPPRLLEQLAIGGRLIIPVGQSGNQELLLLERTASGVVEQSLDRVSFVPLVEGVA